VAYADGLYYHIYSDVKRCGRTTQSGVAALSFHNYLVTCPGAEKWSSVFEQRGSIIAVRDNDGRKYLRT
jgi:beta-xylosidase